MKKLLLIIGIIMVALFITAAYSSMGSVAYVVQAANKDASTSTPGGVVESSASKDKDKVQALSEMRFAGSIAILEEKK